MAVHREANQFIDDTAQATRVTVVSAAGVGAGTQRVTAIQRIATAATTSITAGKVSYTVAVVTAASAASPTLDGVALPVGSYSFEAPPGDTLEAASVVTVSGDDVIVISVT